MTPSGHNKKQDSRSESPSAEELCDQFFARRGEIQNGRRTLIWPCSHSLYRQYCSHRPEQDKSVNTNNYHERLFCLICFSFNRVIKPQPYSHTAVVVWPCSHSLLPSAKTSHKGEHEYHGNYFVVSVFHLTGSSSLSPAAIRRS